MNIGQDSNTFGPYLINISCGITIEKYQVFLMETSESLQFSCSVLVVTFRKPSVLQSFELKFLGLSVTLVFQSFSLYFHKKPCGFLVVSFLFICGNPLFSSDILKRLVSTGFPAWKQKKTVFRVLSTRGNHMIIK